MILEKQNIPHFLQEQDKVKLNTSRSLPWYSTIPSTSLCRDNCVSSVRIRLSQTKDWKLKGTGPVIICVDKELYLNRLLKVTGRKHEVQKLSTVSSVYTTLVYLRRVEKSLIIHVYRRNILYTKESKFYHFPDSG